MWRPVPRALGIGSRWRISSRASGVAYGLDKSPRELATTVMGDDRGEKSLMTRNRWPSGVTRIRRARLWRYSHLEQGGWRRRDDLRTRLRHDNRHERVLRIQEVQLAFVLSPARIRDSGFAIQD